LQFCCVLNDERASLWAAHHLVEKADLDPPTLAKCFSRVERAVEEADEADAMGEEFWLEEWRHARVTRAEVISV
jgi:hypothetical protein